MFIFALLPPSQNGADGTAKVLKPPMVIANQIQGAQLTRNPETRSVAEGVARGPGKSSESVNMTKTESSSLFIQIYLNEP